MQSLDKIFECYFSQPERKVVLATLFDVEGSHVYRPGALMALCEDGACFGAISAGCLEDDLSSHAQSLFEKSGSKIISYEPNTLSDNVFGLGLGCGGGVRVLLESLPDNREESHLYHLKYALDKQIECTSVVLWERDCQTITGSPQRAIIIEDKCIFDSSQDKSALDHMLKAISDKQRVTREVVSEADTNWPSYDSLITNHALQPALTIIGSDEIAKSLKNLAEFLHWKVRIVAAKAAIEYSITESHTQVAIVLLTHNDELELRLLQALLPTDASYIGVLGSRSRIGRIISELEKKRPHWSEDIWRKLHAPVGLDIGSNSAKEIALSIISEIVADSNARSAKPLRDSLTTLHARDDKLSEYMP